jgi:hypothetical protein
MTYKPKRDSRHITLKPEALMIYDRWKADGEASKVSDAIVAHSCTTTDLAAQVQDHEARLRMLEKGVEKDEIGKLD